MLTKKVLFDVILYVPVSNLSVMLGGVFLGLNRTKQGLMCLAQEHNTVTPVRLKPAALHSQVKYSTTELLCSKPRYATRCYKIIMLQDNYEKDRSYGSPFYMNTDSSLICTNPYGVLSVRLLFC